MCDRSRYIDSLLVRSVDRTTASASSSSFQVFSPKPLYGKYMASYIQIPAGVYPISTINNVIYFNEPAGGGALSCQIPVGNYAIGTLATAIGTAMTTASAAYNTYTCTGSALTGKLTTTATNNWYFQWSLTTNSAARAMGYSPGSNTTSATSSTSPNLVDLGIPAALNLSITESTQDGYRSTAGLYGGLWIPYNESLGYYLSMPADTLPQIVSFASPTNGLTIQVQNESGGLVSLNGMEFRFLLRRFGSYPETSGIP